MSLQRKIGQLFVLGFRGHHIDKSDPIARDICDLNLGGVVLFDRLLAKSKSKSKSNNNIISPGQLKTLISSLQSLADTPLLICIDQEGGMVCRLKKEKGFCPTCSAKELGTINDLAKTMDQSQTTARMLIDLGVNCNFAPVVDVNVYPQNPIIGKLGRSFSSHPQEVIDHAAAWIEGHNRSGVVSCLKHFPGHGSSRHDSHLGFVDITATWEERELEPFQELINKGCCDTVMTGHLFHSKLDEQYPATLSPSIINTLLREQMGFEGLVISDDMQMKAITNRYGVEQAACLALAAGVDMIVIGNNLEYDKDILPKCIKQVTEACKNGTIQQHRIDEAYNRVQRIKQKIVRQKDGDENKPNP